MRINGHPYRTIWTGKDGRQVQVIDQTRLPHRFETVALPDLEAAAVAIETMLVRGAPLIGGTAAYGMALAMLADPSDAGVEAAYRRLLRTRPTAVNLRWGLERMRRVLLAEAPSGRAERAFAEAAAICDEDVEICSEIGRHGLALIEAAARRNGTGRVDVLTHCNAGWLATIDRGTATAPIYAAREQGIDVHVWVDETRPRNQGASLTAFELLHEEVPHTIIADNVGGHLMQHGKVDLCIRHRPHHPARRRRQQDRHLPQGAGGARQWRAVLRGAALDHDRLADPGRREGDPDRGAGRCRAHPCHRH
jgi:methylthioribose-1-phosphate isomerase